MMSLLTNVYLLYMQSRYAWLEDKEACLAMLAWSRCRMDSMKHCEKIITTPILLTYPEARKSQRKNAMNA